MSESSTPPWSPPDLLRRVGRLRVPLVVQPSFVVSDRWLRERLGAERLEWAYPFRSLLEQGVRLAGSSDAPVESRDPWSGLTAAIAPRPAGEDRERLGVEEALGLYTHGGCEALGDTGQGTLAPGSAADLVVLGVPRWPEALPLGPRAVVATYRDGRCTYLAASDRPAQGL